MTKRIPQGHAELSMYLPKELKSKFKVACAKRDRPMSEITRQLIEEWLKKEGELD
ncbi:MAG: ribbon-helix-helix protein, CopG family [Richelia sp. RM2_1_2]|nr:ribbon-helix-helix protein, CopG family [Rivularia sp. T60_A2020_040]NJM17368.1 ribbon-helix-helix protein, CopG family [Richelia sp. SM1_7_0]NJN13269.1 ribbon-helix-helix protein, CopG family [Richelia sp. RM1_1_1]NJO26878.1 ribbon-helix-helix protein, CopG family [Richelia sp. SL_2_1]NJO58727.1 ribbon-helix-helix protein, CopG family [Richelia sp. RM2_1_2]